MRFFLAVFSATMLLVMHPLAADSILLEDELLENVIVAFSNGAYKILIPETGETRISPQGSSTKLIATSPPEERARLRSEWERKQGIGRATTQEPKESVTATAEGSIPNKSAPQKLTSAGLRNQQTFIQTATFETQLLLWAQIPPEYREELFAAVAQSAEQTVNLNAGRSELFQAQRESAQDAIAAEAKVLSEQRKETNRALESRQKMIEKESQKARSKAFWADFHSGADYAAGQRNQYNRMIDIGFGDPNYNRMRATQWGYESQRRAASADNKAFHAHIEHGRNSAAIANDAKRIQREQGAIESASGAKIAALDAAKRRALGSQTLLRLQTEDGVARAMRELEWMSALEDALAANYVSSLSFRAIGELETLGNDAEKDFPIQAKGKLWRVMWAVSGPAQSSKLFKLSVSRASDGRAIAGSTDYIAPHERFLILQEHGDFTVSVKGIEDSQCIVVVEELDS